MHAYKARRGYAGAGGEAPARQKLCLYRRIKNVTKRTGGGAVASRKFKVTKRYGGITRNRNAETNGRAGFYSAAGEIYGDIPVSRAGFPYSVLSSLSIFERERERERG